MNNELITFESKKIRRIEHNGEWYFSVVDVVATLVDSQSQDRGAYWRKLKQRLIFEGGNEVVTKCHKLKLTAEDGKKFCGYNCKYHIENIALPTLIEE